MKHPAAKTNLTERLTAALQPLLLYFALAAVFLSLFGLKPWWPALLAGALLPAACAALPGRAGTVLCLGALAASALTAALSARGGLAALANGLFAESEAVNAYAYDYFPVTGDPRPALICIAAFGGAVGGLAPRSRLCASALFFVFAFSQAYFGLTPPLWQSLLLLAALALALTRGASAAQRGAVLAAVGALTLLVLLLAPRPNAAVEAYSESLRDRMGVAASERRSDAQQTREEAMRVHQESRQHGEGADTAEGPAQSRIGYARETETEREISPPRRTDYLRIALLLLAAVALLVVPFLPFLLLSRARRRAEARRCAFADSDNAAAIRAMFACTMDWLRICGLRTDNAPFSRCTSAVRALSSEACAARYDAAVAVWQEASYSDHPMNRAQRDAVRSLMEELQAQLYAKADRRTRLRLRLLEGYTG